MTAILYQAMYFVLLKTTERRVGVSTSHTNGMALPLLLLLKRPSSFSSVRYRDSRSSTVGTEAEKLVRGNFMHVTVTFG
jgi:hypothetical protein